jgi:hypothetical protein
MENIQSSKSILSWLIPFIIAYFGSKTIFYYFSFEYALFSDAFNIEKLLIDLGVFMGLFYIGILLVKSFYGALCA